MEESTNPLLKMSLKELWRLFPIELTPFNPLWKNWFEQEELFLLEQLSAIKVVRINHIGSTAIGGIWAKPIVDILLEVHPMCSFLEVKKIIQQAGYLCMSENPTRIFFNKGYTLQGFASKVFHLHLCYAGDNDELYFRDYLREYPQIAKEYQELKLSLWKLYHYDRDAYTDQKTSFVRQYTLMAKEVYKGRYE